MNRHIHQRFRTSFALLLAVALVVFSAPHFLAQRIPETLYPAAGLTDIRHLSDYNPSLQGTAGDTDVYIFEGGEPGGTLLVLGGTHATEIAGVMTAVLLVETLRVRTGRVIIVPRANASAAGHTMPREAQPAFIELSTPTGARRFRCGARFTNPVHQRPDPLLFRHPASPVIRQGPEARNLNRVYPGVHDGTLTERIAWGIVEMIRQENVDLAFDLHEAPPERNLTNAIVVPQISQDIASEATISLQLAGWDFHLEGSSPQFRGLSHREWADATETRPFLMETANPAQGRLRGRTNAEAVLTGRDPQYATAAQHGFLATPYDSTGVAIETRISRNLVAIGMILQTYNDGAAEAPIHAGGWPSAEELQSEGLGAHLGSRETDNRSPVQATDQ